jgi:hypothetical protein
VVLNDIITAPCDARHCRRDESRTILPVVTRPQLAASTGLFVTLIGLPIPFQRAGFFQL